MPTTCQASPQTAVQSDLLAQNVRIFMQIKSAYEQCAPTIREAIDDMLLICGEADATEEEKSRALYTIVEALFPSLSADLVEAERRARKHPENEAYARALDDEESVFSKRVQDAMAEKGMTQDELAKIVGVSQPAISNMLNRKCRPQRRTVSRIAEALGKKPVDLWPNLEQDD